MVLTMDPSPTNSDIKVDGIGIVNNGHSLEAITNELNANDIGLNHDPEGRLSGRVSKASIISLKDDSISSPDDESVELSSSDVKNGNSVNADNMVNGDSSLIHDAVGKLGLLPKRPLAVSYTLMGTCVVGLRNEVILNVTYGNIPKTIVRTRLLQISACNGPQKDKVICQLKPSRKGTRVYFWPKHIEMCYFTVQSDGCEDYHFKIDVEGNNPVLSFSEDNEWPVAITVKQDDHSIYVAFMHHVSKYNGEGDFVREILREKSIHFNDITTDQLRHRIAVSVSGWRKDGTHKFRFQAVRVYSLAGTPLWSVGKQHPLFGVSIMRIAFDPRGNLLVASKDALCTCAKSTGVVEKRTEASFGTAARMAITHDGHVVVADGNRGHIYVFDDDIRPKSDFPVRLDIDPNDNSRVVGLTGLSVDRFGHIIVSECLTSSIQVYMLDGTLLVLIDSEWDICKWPLALAVSRDGHVFVADHGNACVKKYRYM